MFDFCNKIERITDLGQSSREVRKVPKADVLALPTTSTPHYVSSSSNALACFKSSVSKPSVNQP
jgi:hypothetical protein